MLVMVEDQEKRAMRVCIISEIKGELKLIIIVLIIFFWYFIGEPGDNGPPGKWIILKLLKI